MATRFLLKSIEEFSDREPDIVIDGYEFNNQYKINGEVYNGSSSSSTDVAYHWVYISSCFQWNTETSEYDIEVLFDDIPSDVQQSILNSIEVTNG